jgi:membrane peptidoglycan carboxypeptidase
VWFGNRTTNALAAGFGGPTSGPIWRQFMRDALAGQSDIPIPDRGRNAVCNRRGNVVNQDGGRGAPVDISSPTDTTAPGTPRKPTVITTPPASTTTTTTIPTPTTTTNSPGHGKP